MVLQRSFPPSQKPLRRNLWSNFQLKILVSDKCSSTTCNVQREPGKILLQTLHWLIFLRGKSGSTTSCFAQTRSRKLYNRKFIFFVDFQSVFLKTNTKKKKADHSLLKQPDFDYICNFVHKKKRTSQKLRLIRATSKSSCKESYTKAQQGHTAWNHSFRHRFTIHYT